MIDEIKTKEQFLKVLMEMYERLVKYKNAVGDTLVPKGYEQDKKLAGGVIRQLEHCEEEERVDLLDEIGFDWDPNFTEWMEMYDRLLKYKNAVGDTRVPHRYEQDK